MLGDSAFSDCCDRGLSRAGYHQALKLRRGCPDGIVALFARADVLPGTERASDESRLISQQCIAPCDHNFVARLGQNRVLDVRQVPGEEVTESFSEGFWLEGTFRPNLVLSTHVLPGPAWRILCG
jgi:hypothetical protein